MSVNVIKVKSKGRVGVIVKPPSGRATVRAKPVVLK